MLHEAAKSLGLNLNHNLRGITVLLKGKNRASKVYCLMESADIFRAHDFFPNNDNLE